MAFRKPGISRLIEDTLRAKYGSSVVVEKFYSSNVADTIWRIWPNKRLLPGISLPLIISNLEEASQDSQMQFLDLLSSRLDAIAESFKTIRFELKI